MATSRRNSSMDVAQLNLRIKELENQVSDYKRRLDELRKAKNTTLIKTHKEMVEMNTPQLGVRLNETKIQELQKQLNEQEKKHSTDMAKAKEKITDEPPPPPCGHEAEIDRLTQMVLALEGDNDALALENSDLTDRVDSVLHQLSIKEAQSCEKEEEYKNKIRLEWGERYQEWISKTESKLEELQQTNMLLRTYLKNSARAPDDSPS